MPVAVAPRKSGVAKQSDGSPDNGRKWPCDARGSVKRLPKTVALSPAGSTPPRPARAERSAPFETVATSPPSIEETMGDLRLGALESACLTLLSLFAIPLQLILSLPNPDSRPGTIPRGPLEWGHGPQLEPAPQTKHLVWDSQLDMNKGKKVEVFSVETGDVVYTISELPHDYRTTIISNGQGMELLRFQLKKTATWDHAFVYHTSSAVSYEIHPRGKATDRWYMHVQGDNPETLKYYRGHSANTGNVYLRDTKLAAFQCIYVSRFTP
ncbi:hypothetical protein, variant [Puccinia triticina 1-1 BBBD Race 1]|uniref:Uncharacterized protein n=1 Tax=Puccinia triticina (isolate 1-1 / race 1 (BBBD)) TaxID=630390 RepID=A0A180GD61_PUCT1|nr:hypothetical protein, variant [Puccinia triticina 1-1 BBBD Race 1]